MRRREGIHARRTASIRAVDRQGNLSLAHHDCRKMVASLRVLDDDRIIISKDPHMYFGSGEHDISSKRNKNLEMR
jgi:hypothetical protein